jgi:iron-sulfur cluster repair protein YtfE (RIC family)
MAVVAHQAMRTDVRRLVPAVAYAADHPASVRPVARWFGRLRRTIELHHRAEDALVVEPLAVRAGLEVAPVVSGLREQHAELERMFERVSAGFASGVSPAALSGDVTVLADLVDRHLVYEERELFPLLERWFEPGERELLWQEVARQHGRGGVAARIAARLAAPRYDRLAPSFAA